MSTAILVALYLVVGVLLGVRSTNRFLARLDARYPLIPKEPRSGGTYYVMIAAFALIWPYQILIDGRELDKLFGKREKP